jgi:hypothetical protein
MCRGWRVLREWLFGRGPVDEMYLLEWEERSKRSFFGTKARAREGRIHQYPGRKEENEER